MTETDPNSHRFTADSVERAMAVIGDRWTFLILREAFFGVRRFSQLARNLGITRNLLARRLESLVEAVPLENRIRPVTCGFSESGGVRVFIDQAVENGPSMEQSVVEVDHGSARSVRIVIGDALHYALVRPGRVVMHLIFG